MNLFSRRPRFQLSLRTVLVLFLMVCVLVGLSIRWRQRAVLQQSVVRQLRGNFAGESSQQIFGGVRPSVMPQVYCRYDYQQTDDPVQRRLFEPKPSWLSSIFGVDMIHSIKEIELGRLADSDDFELIGRLGYLTHLELVDGVTEAKDWEFLFALDSLTSLKLNAAHSEGVVEHSAGNRFERIGNLTKLKELHLVNPRLHAAEWMQIFRHPSLEMLELIHFEDSDSSPGLSNDSQSPIQKLYLNDCRASGASIQGVLSKTPQLNFLSVDHRGLIKVNLSDQIFESISRLERLEQLFLHRTNVQGHTLHLLRKLPLKKLGLGLSNLDDQGLESLIGFDQLEYLEIGSTQITDQGMIALAQLTNLEYLSIRDTAVTDQGLLKLLHLSRLKTLRIRDTQITEEGVQNFRLQRPDCLVDVQ